MDHKEFLTMLTPQERDALTARSDAKGLAHLAVHWGLILICGAGIAAGVAFWPVLLVVQGVLIIFLFTLLHETLHRTPFRSDWLNVLVGHFCGFLLFLPATWFRFFHMAHHRFTQIPGKDPELGSPKPETPLAFVLHVSGGPVWLTQARMIGTHIIGRAAADYVPQAREKQVVREARLYVLGYLALAVASFWMGSELLFYVWLLPLLLGQPFLRVYLLAEHGRCAFVANMFENTRTTFTNRLVKFLAWNMPYHTEHHAYPSVPFHNLPRLHAHMAPHLKETAPGYKAFTKDYVQKTMLRH